MKKQILFIAVVAILVGMFAASAAAQMTTTVSGSAKDEQGKPMAGLTVILQSTDSGRKYTLKTDKKGEFFSLGIQPGSYNIVFMNGSQQVFSYGNVPLKLAASDKDNRIDLDLKKERAAQEKSGAVSEAQKAQIEAQKKANEKIKGLNEKLAAARAAKEAGNYDEAVQLLQEAVAMDATHDVIWASLADAYSGAKKYPEAIEAYQKAIAIAPKGEYYNNLGQAYLKNNQVEQAIDMYNKAAAADPTNAAMYYFNLGAVLTNKNKLTEANEAFDKAIAADPNKAEAYYWKGVNMFANATVDKSGKMIAPPGTAENLNKYLELAPTGPLAQGAKDLLATMGAKVETSFGKEKPAKKKP